jgi:hypothetical protein
MPKAPVSSWRSSRMTVRENRGSPIVGAATSSWPASELPSSRSPGEVPGEMPG